MNMTDWENKLYRDENMYLFLPKSTLEFYLKDI